LNNDVIEHLNDKEHLSPTDKQIIRKFNLSATGTQNLSPTNPRGSKRSIEILNIIPPPKRMSSVDAEKVEKELEIILKDSSPNNS
jgi:hypothetical protein